jgi:glycosyltransferase involved in cell wall biosynthesis
MPSLGGGGAEKIVLRLMRGFISRGIKVKLVLATPHGSLHSEIPNKVDVIHLNAKRSIFAIFRLAKYIRTNKPEIILSHLSNANRVALLATIISKCNTKVYVVEHNTMSIALKHYSLIQKWLLIISYKYLYYRAHKIIHVSKAAANDLMKLLPKHINSVHTIYNPIINEEMINSIVDKPPHDWLYPGNIPVILGVGLFREQKDFITLIQGFSIVKKYMDAHLILLGRGPLEEKIKNEAIKYNLENSILFPGYVDDPLGYMKHSSVFVLSSRWEALPTVIVEALACGCPVVSTNCPSGPAEILDNGKYGILVPVQNAIAMAHGIISSIKNPPDKKILISRAMDFSIEKSVNNYLGILQSK